MANIREYSAPSDAYQATEAGADALTRAGSRVNVLYDEAGALAGKAAGEVGEALKGLKQHVEKYYGLQEIAKGASTFADIRNSADAQAQKMLSDPNAINDPAIGAKVNAQIAPIFDKFVDTMDTDTGRRWATEQVAHAKEAFSTKVAADTKTLAGIGMTSNLNEWMKTNGNIVERDPSTLESELKMIDPTLKALAETMPGLSAIDRAKFVSEHGQTMRSHMSTIALNKLALTNVGAAKSGYEAGRFADVDPVHAEQILKMGEAQARQNAALGRANAEFAQRQASNKALGSVLGQIGDLKQQVDAGDATALDKLHTLSNQILLDGQKSGMTAHDAYTASQIAHAAQREIVSQREHVEDRSRMAEERNMRATEHNENRADRLEDRQRMAEDRQQRGIEHAENRADRAQDRAEHDEDRQYRLANRPILDDQPTVTSLRQGLGSTTGAGTSESDIATALRDQKISLHTAMELNQNLKLFKEDPNARDAFAKFNDAVKQYSPLLSGLQSMQVPGFGHYRMNEFYNDHMQAMMDGLKRGIPIEQLLSREGIFKDLNDYLTMPDNEESVFGKAFSMPPGFMGSRLPESVRVMEAYRQATQDKKQRQQDIDKAAGITIKPSDAYTGIGIAP